MSYRLMTNPALPNNFYVDNNTGKLVPYLQGSPFPVWNLAVAGSETLALASTPQGGGSIMSAVLWNEITYSTNNGSTWQSPSSITDLVNWIAANMYNVTVDVSGGSGGGGDIVTKQIRVTPTVQTESTYTPNYVVGGVLTFSGLPTTSSIITSIRLEYLMDNSVSAPALPCVLFLFSSAPTGTYTDNTAFAPTASDLANLVAALVPESIAVPLNNNYNVSNQSLIGQDIQSPSNELWCVLVVTGAEAQFIAQTDESPVSLAVTLGFQIS